MEQTVNVWVIRHGEKKGDSLTVIGEAQVAEAYHKNLSGVKFRSVVTSNYARTTRTAEIIAALAGYSDEINRDCRVSAGRLISALVAADQEYRAADPDCDSKSKVALATRYPVLHQGGGVFLECIMDHAILEAAYEPQKEGINILVAGHTNIVEYAYPPAELAIYNGLPPAGIVLFTIVVKDDEARLVGVLPLDQAPAFAPAAAG